MFRVYLNKSVWGIEWSVMVPPMTTTPQEREELDRRLCRIAEALIGYQYPVEIVFTPEAQAKPTNGGKGSEA
jgi:hypothetical protein